MSILTSEDLIIYEKAVALVTVKDILEDEFEIYKQKLISKYIIDRNYSLNSIDLVLSMLKRIEFLTTDEVSKITNDYKQKMIPIVVYVPNRRKRKRSSPVWDIFDKTHSYDVNRLVVCKECGCTLIHYESSCTSNLLSHYRVHENKRKEEIQRLRSKSTQNDVALDTDICSTEFILNECINKPLNVALDTDICSTEFILNECINKPLNGDITISFS